MEGQAMSASSDRSQPQVLSLRLADQESARVVAVHRQGGEIVGAGCLLNKRHILTCLHVSAAALAPNPVQTGASVLVTLVGVTGQPTMRAEVKEVGAEEAENDLALLELTDDPRLNV